MALTDPSRFVISVAVGCAHVLVPVLGFLERVTSMYRHDDDHVLLVLVPLVLLALLLPFAYLRLAADGYRRIVERSNNVTPELEQAAAALSPAALPWLRNLDINVSVAFPIFSFVLHIDLRCRRARRDAAEGSGVKMN